MVPWPGLRGVGDYWGVLPGLPTTIFLIVALWAFARSSPRLHAWLLHHPKLGPPLRAWHDHRSIPRKAKILAIGMMVGSLALLWFSTHHVWLTVGVGVVLVGVATYLLTRPSQPTPLANKIAAHPGHPPLPAAARDEDAS